MVCKAGQEIIKKPFRFLNFWCSHHSFKEEVKRALTVWSKVTVGNIFKKNATMEDVIKVKEVQLEMDSQGVELHTS